MLCQIGNNITYCLKQNILLSWENYLMLEGPWLDFPAGSVEENSLRRGRPVGADVGEASGGADAAAAAGAGALSLVSPYKTNTNYSN